VAGHDKITPDGKKLFEQLKELAKLEVKVGYQSEELASIALWNELGTKDGLGIPPRPFLRNSVDDNEETIKKMCYLQIEKVAKGETTVSQALSALGTMQVGLVQHSITDGTFEPNAPSTIKQKGSDRPLVNRGDLAGKITYAIGEKGGS